MSVFLVWTYTDVDDDPWPVTAFESEADAAREAERLDTEATDPDFPTYAYVSSIDFVKADQ